MQNFVVKKRHFPENICLRKVETAIKVVAIVPNSFGATKGTGSAAVETTAITPTANRITVKK